MVADGIADILLVEDNSADIKLTQKAFEKGKIKNHLSIARDGEDALEFLRREGEYEDAPRPDLILLDLFMPKMGGQEFLEIVKADDAFKAIPVVILTTSDADQDIVKGYTSQASAFITKPVDFHNFIEVIHKIEDFYLAIVKLPPN
ncbi:MAG: response regulator [Lentisphaeria bacterium]|nr:response regulator [Lentisphaeria bacterium]